LSEIALVSAIEMQPSEPMAGGPPLIAHVLYRLDYGGLENGVVNLLNNLPQGDFRHAIICLVDYTEFRSRIVRPDVTVHALHKPPGHSLATHLRMYRLLRELKPSIVHSRNLAALESQPVAALAGVPVRIHSECLTSEIFGSLRCDCRAQRAAGRRWAAHGPCRRSRGSSVRPGHRPSATAAGIASRPSPR
jgi:hypothetical protein